MIRKTVFILAVISVFLPWFTYNSDMMGYFYGFYFLDCLAVPLIIMALDVFGVVKDKRFKVLSVVASPAYIVIWILTGLVWQERANIIGGLHPEDLLYTAIFGYWVSGALMIINFVMTVAGFWRCEKEK